MPESQDYQVLSIEKINSLIYSKKLFPPHPEHTCKVQTPGAELVTGL